MTVITLAHYNMKRLLRRKVLRLVLVLAPVAAGLLSVALPSSLSKAYVIWPCPIVCALTIGAALYTQWAVDSATGLTSGLRSCPIPPKGLVASRVVSGACILVVQMAVFIAILTIRH